MNEKVVPGNPHVRFDEGEVASAATPMRGFPLYKRSGKTSIMTWAAVALTALWSDAAGGTAARKPRDSWAGIASHPAVVNPAVRPADDPDTVSLRGTWDFWTEKPNVHRDAFARLSVERRWRNSVKKGVVRPIQVPGCWEAQGVGTNAMSRPWVCYWDCSPKPIRNAFWGEGWYRKAVVIPAAWKGRRIWLKTGIVGTEGWFWVNGRPAADVQLYCGTVKYEVTDMVTPGGTNSVVAAVSNAGSSRLGNINAMNSWGGILRDVEFESTPHAFIDDAWVRGDFDGRAAEVRVEMDGDFAGAAPLTLRVEIDGCGAETSVAAPGPQTLRLPLADFRPWAPEHPNLYTARVDLVSGGRVVQTRRERFGVRKFEVRGGEFYLNDRPFFMRGAGWHAFYPIEGAPPADRDLYRRLARRIRSAGFNFCRFHSACRPPELFDACDEIGLMLQPELPYYNDIPASGQTFDPFGDAEELYLNYRRHPSFAIYCGGNEGWFGEITSKSLYAEVKSRDPDRLMLGQDTSFSTRANLPGMSDFQGGPVNVWPRGSLNPDVPFVCHEYLNLSVKLDSRTAPLFTGAWMPPTSRDARKAWLGRFGLTLEQGDSLQDAQAVMQRTWRKYGIESARLDPCCDGYSYWSLQDACSPNGENYSGQALFDPMWGDKPHGDTAESVAVYNSESCLLLDVGPKLYDSKTAPRRGSNEMFLTDFATNRVRSAGERIAATFYLAHYGEAPLKSARLVWRLTAEGKALASGTRDVGDQPLGHVREIGFADIAVPEVASACRATLEARLVSGRMEIANSWDWWLFPRRRRIDGRGVFVAEPFRRALEGRFQGLAPTLAEADVVVAPPASGEAAAARAAGKRLVTIVGTSAPANITLGWWWMGKQMGAVFAQHRALRFLPHDGFLTPLQFRIMRDGGRKLTPGTAGGLIVYGEGGDGCYSYLAEIRHPSGAHEYRVDGIDLLADLPEADAILRGLVSGDAQMAARGDARPPALQALH